MPAVNLVEQFEPIFMDVLYKIEFLIPDCKEITHCMYVYLPLNYGPILKGKHLLSLGTDYSLEKSHKITAPQKCFQERVVAK